jgi:hypothetical protein
LYEDWDGDRLISKRFKQMDYRVFSCWKYNFVVERLITLVVSMLDIVCLGVSCSELKASKENSSYVIRYIVLDAEYMIVHMV